MSDGTPREEHERIAKIRQDFPIFKEYVYLDNAAIGAGSKSVYGTMGKYTKEYARNRMGLSSDLKSWTEKITETKEQFARLIGGDKSEVFFVPAILACLYYSRNTVIVTTATVLRLLGIR